MGEFITLSCHSHVRRLLDGIWTNLQEGLSADFELSFKNEAVSSLKAHHVIVSAFCPPLKCLSEKKFSFEDELELSKEDVDTLIEFIYRGKVKVNEARLRHLKAAAEAIGLGVLIEIIDKLLDKQTRPELSKVAVESSELSVKRKRKPTEAFLQHRESLVRRRSKRIREKHPENEEKQGESESSAKLRDENVRDAVKNCPDMDVGLEKVRLRNRVVVLPAESRAVNKRKHMERLKNMLKKLNDNDKQNNESSDGKTCDSEALKESCETQAEVEDPDEVKNAVKEVAAQKKTPKGAKDTQVQLSPWLKQKILQLSDENTAEYQHKCELCGAVLIGFFRQFRHMQCHENPNLVLKCSRCPFQTEMDSDLNHHLAEAHELDPKGEPLPKTFHCSDCDLSFFKSSQLRWHQHQVHRQSKYKCGECAESFPLKLALIEHQSAAHRNEVPLTCASCGFTTDFVPDLKNHRCQTAEPQRVLLIDTSDVNLQGFEAGTSVIEVPQDLVSDSELNQLIVLPSDVIVPQETKAKDEISCHLCSFTASMPFTLKFHLKTLHKLSAEEVAQIIKKS